MSDVVTVAMISTVGAILVAILTRLNFKVNRVGRDAAEARDQTTNAHETNLREELDKRHAETTDWFKSLSKSVGGIRDDLRLERKRVDHLYELETTHPRRREP